MDTLPLPPKPPVLASDISARQQQAASTQPVGSEATQTVQAVQAIEKTETHSSLTEGTVAEPTAEQLADMAEQMDKFVGSFTHELKFRVDEDSGRNVVTVIDSKSGDTIRQIPTEELLDVIARLAEASSGLIDVKA
ncbi:hypothetical protein GCM10011502_17990 [Oceanisphaera marina]|uniref:Flagellar biosynthesis protein FlaG n=1 Tax=Oceanisphaera marina TaxID=2017550 RepID=A0ABQ1IMM6_9GAMM|nr:flagellar protein FlaG [Oceanisphaera marina]GGB45093.1 hypothetical protein GCM10011502_17990 [Oceanisphaera marina]